MRKELVHEMEVAASADAVWAVYSSPGLPRLVAQLLPTVFEKIEIVEGNGGVGTVLHLTFPPGSVPLTYKEKFVTIDDKKRLKEVLQIEGGYLDLGCTFYMDSFHIIEKGRDSCIIKSTTVYEVKDELANQVAPLITIDSLSSMAETLSKYVLDHPKGLIRKELVHELEVAAPADDVWAIYSSPDLPKLVAQLLPTVFEKIDVVEGNGGVGTVLHLTFPPGSVPLTYKEKFMTIDHKKRLKEVLQIEGGYLDLGCTFYMDSFHILEKGRNSCIIKSTTFYEVKAELADQVAPLITIDSLSSMAETLSKYVLGKQAIIRKELVHELKVAASADDVWEVYSLPDLPKLVAQLLPTVFEKIEVVEGNGGVGTVLHLTFPPGSIPLTYKEKFITIDHKKRLKEVLQIEGGYLELGCTYYMDSFRIIEKGCDSCIIKSTTVYEVKELLADKVAPLITIDSLSSMAETLSKYVLEKQENSCCDGRGSDRFNGKNDCDGRGSDRFPGKHGGPNSCDGRDSDRFRGKHGGPDSCDGRDSDRFHGKHRRDFDC